MTVQPIWREGHDGRHLKFAAAEDFALKLRTLLAEKDMSASDLARELFGTTVITGGYTAAKHRDRVSKWLKGRSLPDPKILEDICRVLNVNPAKLAPVVVAAGLGAEHPQYQMTEVPGHRDKVHFSFNSVIDTRLALRFVEMLLGHSARAPTPEELNAEGASASASPSWTADANFLTALAKTFKKAEAAAVEAEVNAPPDPDKATLERWIAFARAAYKQGLQLDDLVPDSISGRILFNPDSLATTSGVKTVSGGASSSASFST